MLRTRNASQLIFTASNILLSVKLNQVLVLASVHFWSWTYKGGV